MTEVFEAPVLHIEIPPRALSDVTCASAVIEGPGSRVDAHVSVKAVGRRMSKQRLDHVVVTDEHGPLGIVTLREVQGSLTVDAGSPGERPIVHLVTATPCVSPDASASQVCRALLTSRQRAVLVLEDDGALVGVVTSDDILKRVIEAR